MKKKILIINHSLQQGGIVRSLISALSVIDSDKYDVTLYVHRDVPELKSLLPSYVKLVVNRDGNHYYRLPKAVALQAAGKVFTVLGDKKRAAKINDRLNAYVRSRKVLHPLRDYFRDESFDAVIAYSVDICTEIALTIPADRHYAFFHSSKADFHRDMTERCFPQFDRIIAVGGGVEAVLREGFPELDGKIVRLDNFTDAVELKRLSEEKSVYPAGHDKSVICSCGRLTKEKGFDLAVGAAAILKKRGIDFKWYFVGDGDDRGALEKSIADNGLNDDIAIIGYLLNPYPYMAGCDIYVQPSYEEAQPLAIMEAFMLGRAIVSTDTVGGRTILKDGELGVIAPVTAEGLADGVGKLLTDPEYRASLENKYGPADAERDRQRFSDAWEELLSGRM